MNRLTPENALEALRNAKGKQSVELFTHRTLTVKVYKPDKIDRQQPPVETRSTS